MKIISKIAIRDFRSVHDAEVTELGNLTALAGLSSSGKSNVLRALNAFFTGEVEPGKPLVVSRDHYRPAFARSRLGASGSQCASLCHQPSGSGRALRQPGPRAANTRNRSCSVFWNSAARRGVRGACERTHHGIDRRAKASRT